MRSQADGGGWSNPRAIRRDTNIPVTRPERLRAIPIADLARMFAAWNRGNLRARLAYYHDTRGPAHHTIERKP